VAALETARWPSDREPLRGGDLRQRATAGVGPRAVEGGHEGEGDRLAQLAQGGFAALPVGVSAKGIPEADRQALCSLGSAAIESSGAVELGGVAVLPSNGVVAQRRRVAGAWWRGIDVVSASPACASAYISARPVLAALGGPEQRLAACCRRSAEASQSPRWARIRAFQRRPWLGTER